MMNPETNRFEEVHPKVEDALEQFDKKMPDMSGYVRHDGSEVPKGYPIFGVGEEFQLKGYRFKVKAIKEDEIIFEPVGSVPVSKIRSVVYTKKVLGLQRRKRKVVVERRDKMLSDKAICWTCNKFVYSGELDIGYCYYHDRNVKQDSLCIHHPDYVEGDFIDIEDEDES